MLQDGERLIPVKMTVKFYDNQDPTLHIVIASDKTQNKSIPEDAAGTQNAHHVAGDTLTSMSLSDFLGLVNGSEQFTKRMPDISRKTAKGQFPLLYTERLLEHAKRDGYIYSQRLLQREIEKARREIHKARSKANGSRPTIYADRLSQYGELVDFEDKIDSDDLNADFENDANSGMIEMNRRKQPTHRKISPSGRKIIDKATYNKVTVPAIRKGADIRTADDEWMRYLEMQKSTAVTFGDIIILRPDATTSEVLEEIHHFYQNRAALNNQYGEDQRRVMNELDTLEYLLSVSDKYKIPAEEIEETKLLQEFYRNKKERLKREGEWID